MTERILYRSPERNRLPDALVDNVFNTPDPLFEAIIDRMFRPANLARMPQVRNYPRHD